MTLGSRTISVFHTPPMRRLIRSVLALPDPRGSFLLATLAPSSRSTLPARLPGVPARNGAGVPDALAGVSAAEPDAAAAAPAAALLLAFLAAARRPRWRSSSSWVRSGSLCELSESHWAFQMRAISSL